MEKKGCEMNSRDSSATGGGETESGIYCGDIGGRGMNTVQVVEKHIISCEKEKSQTLFLLNIDSRLAKVPL